MYYIDYCLICGSKKLDAFSCKIAPFLSERTSQSTSLKVKLLRCNICRFAFYNARLDSEEVARLYKDYRGEEYQKQKQKHEKLYTPQHNYNLGHDDDVIIRRKKHLSALLKKYATMTQLNSVLDYGGDYGQYIPDELSKADKFVFEISGVKPPVGIKLITDMKEAENYSFDLIMCCHVLEHVSSPRSEVEKLIRFARENSIFYFEVPVELVNFLATSGLIQSMNFRQYCTGRSLSATFKTFMRKFPRNCLLGNHRIYNALFPVFDILGLKFFSMNEHVTFFTTQAMKSLVESCGLTVLYADVVPLLPGKVNISCLAALKGEGVPGSNLDVVK